MRSAFRVLLAGTVLVWGAALGGCGDGEPAPPGPAPVVEPPSPQATASAAALNAYTTFWAVTDAARAAPTARDWRPEIEAVASGQALATALLDIRNYASLPAHTEGTISRDPTVSEVSASRATIHDCVDLGDSRLVHDVTGETLDDLANRVERFRLRAEVVVAADGRWRVDRTEPSLEEPC